MREAGGKQIDEGISKVGIVRGRSVPNRFEWLPVRAKMNSSEASMDFCRRFT